MDRISSIFSLRGSAQPTPPAFSAAAQGRGLATITETKSAGRKSTNSIVDNKSHGRTSNEGGQKKSSARLLREYIYIKKFIETPSCTKNKLARLVKMADFEVFNQGRFLRTKIWSILLPDISPFQQYPLDIGWLYVTQKPPRLTSNPAAYSRGGENP